MALLIALPSFEVLKSMQTLFPLWVTRTVSPKAWENFYSALEKSTGNLNLWINEAWDTTKIKGTHGNPTLWIRMEKSTGNQNLWINEAWDTTKIKGTHGNSTLCIRMEKSTGNQNLWTIK